MHTEYGVPEVKEQQPRSFARDCITQKRRLVAIAGSKNSRCVTSASFLPFRSSRLGHCRPLLHWLSVPGCSVVCSTNESSFPSPRVGSTLRSEQGRKDAPLDLARLVVG